MLSKKCYLCNHSGLQTAFYKLGHRILKCSFCGLYSLDFSGNYEEFLNDYYSKGFFTGGKHYRAYADYLGDKKTVQNNMKKYLTVIKKYLPKNKTTDKDYSSGVREKFSRSLSRTQSRDSNNKKQNTTTSELKLLDLGCAMGFLIELAQKQGFNAMGVDVSEYALAQAKKLVGKDKVILGRVEELTTLLSSRDKSRDLSQINSGEKDSSTHLAKRDFGRNDKDEKFDVVTMFDLVEHVKNPKQVLQQIHEIISDGGLLVIQTGDASSSWAKLMGKNWHFFAPPQHFFFYGQKNLEELLKQTGFKVIKIQKIGKWVSLRYLFHMMRYINKDSIGDILYKLTAKNFVGQIPIYMRMNDNMIVLAKKQ